MRVLGSGMSVDTTTTELKFPAPVCDTCHIPMVTVTQQQTGSGPSEIAVSYAVKNAVTALAGNGGDPVANRWLSYRFRIQRERAELRQEGMADCR